VAINCIPNVVSKMDDRRMKYLITGGAGFIGSHLSEALLTQGHSIDIIDNFDPYYDRQIKEENIHNLLKDKRINLFEIDIQNYTDIKAHCGDTSYNAIIHLAAKAGVRPSIVNPIEYQNVNVGGTQNMLEFARAKNIKQFIYGSSSSVYGINPNTPWSEDDNVLLPISPYASSKVSGELLGHVYSQLFGLRFIALRFFTVYGPRQRPDLAIHKFVKRIFNDESIPIYGDGTTSRDYTYVEDIITGIISATNYTGSMYEVINLGNSKPMSLSDLIMHIETAVGKNAIIDRQPMQAGDVNITYANISKAKELLNYKPMTENSEGLAKFVDWFKQNV